MDLSYRESCKNNKRPLVFHQWMHRNGHGTKNLIHYCPKSKFLKHHIIFFDILPPFYDSKCFTLKLHFT